MGDIPDPGDTLRDLLGLTDRNQPDDSPPGEKSNYPRPTLIKLAIYGGHRKRLALPEIYQTIEDRFE